ncbi:MAG: tetratricopeptide repeat protein [bacterium]|nr:tetratricopeptide repeat protein [bacterium]
MAEDLQRFLDLADRMQEQGQFPEAEMLYLKLLQLVPGNVNLLLRLLAARFAQDKKEQAAETYREILELQPDCADAHVMMARFTQPGDEYLTLIKRFHHWLKPAGYVEIGVETGQSLSLVLPRTRAVGIDPNLQLKFPLTPLTRTYEMTSDDFFVSHNLLEELENQPVQLSFIDGLHLFEQALKDFMNIERYASKETVVLVHDCFPLDKATSTRERGTFFWSGDTWKTIVCLREYRPDLNLFTIPASPTGLGVITNLDPKSTVLEDHYDEIVAKFKPMDYDYLDGKKEETLNVIPNQWAIIKEKLGR